MPLAASAAAGGWARSTTRRRRGPLKARARSLQRNQGAVEYVGEHGGACGHDYFRTNPAVSCDLVLTVRYGREPGAENGRPPRHRDSLFREIDDDYLLGPAGQ